MRYTAIKLEGSLPYITPDPEHNPYAPIFLLGSSGAAPVIAPEPEDYPHAPYVASDNLSSPKDDWRPFIKSESSGGNSIKQEVHDSVNISKPRNGFSVLQSAMVDDKEYLNTKGFCSGPSDEIKNEQNEEEELLPSTFQLPLRSLGSYPPFET